MSEHAVISKLTAYSGLGTELGEKAATLAMITGLSPTITKWIKRVFAQL